MNSALWTILVEKLSSEEDCRCPSPAPPLSCLPRGLKTEGAEGRWAHAAFVPSAVLIQ